MAAPVTPTKSVRVARASPATFVREVRAEVTKVTWPSRRETMVTTGLVLAMAAIMAVLFFAADQIFGLAVRSLFGAGI